jgi:hypothetical protein
LLSFAAKAIVSDGCMARWRAPAHRALPVVVVVSASDPLSLLSSHRTAADGAGTADAHITEARVVALVAATFDDQIMAPALLSSSFVDPLRRASRSDCPFRHAAFLPLLACAASGFGKKKRENGNLFW